MARATAVASAERFRVGVSAGNRDRAHRERLLRRLMARQHGLVHRDQALASGVSPSGIHRRIKAGAWLRHYRCVYGVAGAPETLEQRALAACLAAGPSAAISHVTAAAMWGWCSERIPIHVTVPGQVTARPSGVLIHRTAELRRSDVGKLRGVPVTSPTRTLLDVAAVLSDEETDEILQRAVASGGVVPETLRERAASSRCRRPPGRARVERLLPPAPRRSHVPSPLERSVAGILRECGGSFVCEHPVHVDGRVFYVDFAFPHLRVAIEADGRRWHSDPKAFERDRERHNSLTEAGWRVLRVTEQQVRCEPQAVRDQVLRLLVRG